MSVYEKIHIENQLLTLSIYSLTKDLLLRERLKQRRKTLGGSLADTRKYIIANQQLTLSSNLFLLLIYSLTKKNKNSKLKKRKKTK